MSEAPTKLTDEAVEALRQVISYDPETGEFTRNGVRTGELSHRGYWRISFRKRLHLAHRVAWRLVYGRWPQHQIDHINGIKTDNRIANLREATPSQNQLYNTAARSDNMTGYRGATKARGGKFRALLKVNGRQRYIGLFDTPEAAHAAYLEAKRKHLEGDTP